MRVLLFGLGLALAAASVVAQRPSIAAFDGGGAIASSGQYRLTGVIGGEPFAGGGAVQISSGIMRVQPGYLPVATADLTPRTAADPLWLDSGLAASGGGATLAVPQVLHPCSLSPTFSRSSVSNHSD